MNQSKHLFLFVVYSFFLIVSQISAQEIPFIKAEISVASEVRDQILKNGRLLFYMTQKNTKEPRFGSEIAIGFTPENWDISKSIELDSRYSGITTIGFDKHLLEQGQKYYYQAVYIQNMLEAPDSFTEKICSKVDSVEITPGQILKATLNKILPLPKVVEHQFVKTVILKSKLLSNFFGKPRYLKASVLLPSEYFKNQDKSYPICYRVPGINGRYDAVNQLVEDKQFSDWWFSGNAPQIIYVFLDSQGPFGDMYQVDSENNGPCGKALTEELIPEIENQVRYNKNSEMRFLTGYSTGGWVSLALQIFYPDFFYGTWSYSPDPVDFEHFGLINIYKDESVFYNQYGCEQPGKRTIYGEPTRSMKDWIAGDNLISWTNNYLASGGQFGCYNAVFSPKGEGGLPALMFDPFTGKIDRSIAVQWEKYDLKKVLEKNWSELGPKLQGKIWIWTGDMDGYYSNVATRFLKEFFDKTDNPKSDAEVLFTSMAGHCQEWDDKALLLKIEERCRKYKKEE